MGRTHRGAGGRKAERRTSVTPPLAMEVIASGEFFGENRKRRLGLCTTRRFTIPMQKIKILLADDHTVVRQGLRALLAAEPDIEVVGEAENGRQAVQLARKLTPEVV